MQGILALMVSQVLIKLLGLAYKWYLTNKEGFGADEINELTGLLGALEKQEKSLKTIQSRLNKDKSVEAKTLQKELKEELVLRQRQINAIKNVQNAYNEVKEKNSDARVFSEDENEIVNAVQTQNKHLEYNNTLYEIRLWNTLMYDYIYWLY